MNAEREVLIMLKRACSSISINWDDQRERAAGLMVEHSQESRHHQGRGLSG